MMRQGVSVKKSTTRAVTWLHLSDVHFCPEKTGWDAAHVLRSLRIDLRLLQQEYGLHPDLIFFTGDLAFGQLPDSHLDRQYQEAARFLDGIRESFDPVIDRSMLFLVPGNHDVNRGRVGRPDTYWLDSLKGEEGAHTISVLMRDNSLEWRRFMERLADYRRFLENYGYDHLLKDPDRLVYAVTRTVSGFRIGIAGFNTAWSCCREAEDGKLWLGRWQIETLRSQLDDCNFRIALTHHPFNWLHQAEDPILRREIEETFDFHLHGHEHLGWADAFDHHVRVAAGACYEQSEKENGYSMATILPLAGRGKILFRRYDTTGRGWVARNISRKAENNGCWNLRLTWLNPELQQKIEKFLEQIEVSLVGIDVLDHSGIASGEFPAVEISVGSLPHASELLSPHRKPPSPPAKPRGRARYTKSVRKKGA
jgi:predicted MPP superfamily phosphohydrolase